VTDHRDPHIKLRSLVPVAHALTHIAELRPDPAGGHRHHDCRNGPDLAV
jgi:hypothetical protein